MRSLAACIVSSPSTRMQPRSGCRMRMIMRRVVVLPDPFGPMKP